MADPKSMRARHWVKPAMKEMGRDSWPTRDSTIVGALHGKRTRKGVFITTGHFSEDAIDYVNNIEPKVILIDGRNLASLMIDCNLGTTTAASYELKRIDSDYFGEE
jgi:restriction endonuclease Mrr